MKDLDKNNYINNKWKTKNILEQYKINDTIVSNINYLLSNKNELNNNNIFKELEKLINNIKIIYKRFWKTIEEKQLILEFIFENIQKLFMDLNLRRVHNNSSWINPEEFMNYWFNNQISQLLYIKNKDILDKNIKWASCNYWVIWFYKLIYTEILNEDESIKINFSLNKDNHWKLYFWVWNKIYMYENNRVWFKVIESSTISLENNYQTFDNVKKYIDAFKVNSYEEWKISFWYNWMILWIYRENNKILVQLSSKKGEKKMYFEPKNLEDFKKQVFSEELKEYNDFLEIAFNKIDLTKLENILNENILVVITWKSWAWKTTLRKELEKYWFNPIITTTTRNPRIWEQELIDYKFIKNSDFHNINFCLVWTNEQWDKYGIKKEYLNKKWKKVLVTWKWWIDELSKMVQDEILEYKNILLVNLDFSNFTLIKRLLKRWDDKKNIRKRLCNDTRKYEWFTPNLKTLNISNWNTQEVKMKVLTEIINNYPLSFIFYLIK